MSEPYWGNQGKQSLLKSLEDAQKRWVEKMGYENDLLKIRIKKEKGKK